jgi:hypothetical protein
MAPDVLNQYSNDLNLYEKVLAQKHSDSNKIYSLHNLK